LLRFRTWRRATCARTTSGGPSRSCACAAVVAGIRLGLVDSPVEVHTRGGDLTIAWRGADNPVTMTGPAATVFEGEIEIE